MGGDFVLPAASWLLLGCSEASCRCKGELIQGKGRRSRGRVKMRGEVYLICKECYAGIGGCLALRAIQVVWGTTFPSVGRFPSMLASGRLLQTLSHAACLLPTRLEARRRTPPFN